MKKSLFTALCAFFTLWVQAQNKEKDSVTALKEVVVIEQGIQKKANGITPSQTLEKLEMERFGPLDVAATINQISGVYMLSGALNTNRITIRGVGARTPFGTNKLRMYFNNIPITNGTGTSELEAYDLQNLGAIEVIKGPKATTFGSNLGGAIILNTKAPEVGRTLVANTFTTGSYNLVKNNLAVRHSEENMNLNISYNHLQTDGFRQNNRFDRDGLLLTSSFRLGSKDKLDVLFNHIDYTAQIASSINQTDFEENPRQAAGNWLAAQGFEANKYTLAGLTYTHRFLPNVTHKTSVFYTYLDHYEPRPFNILDEFTNGFGLRSLFEGAWGKMDYTLGTELYKDEYNWGTFENLYQQNNGQGSLQGNELSRNKEFRDQLNLFATLRIPLTERLTAQGGLNFNSTRWDFRDLFNSDAGNRSAERRFNGLVLPNFSLQYQMPNGQVYANVGRGFSNPSLEETLTPDGVINPDIDQETGTNYELGGQFSWLNNRLRLHAAVYRMDINNLLVAQRVGEDEFIGQNAGQTRHQGLELDVSYSFSMGTNMQLSPHFSYTLNDHTFVEFLDRGNDYSGNPLTGVPKNRLNAGLTLSHDNGLQFLATHQFVDEIPLTDANTLQSEAFHLFNAQIRYGRPLAKKFHLDLNLGLNNIFDLNYAQSVLINAVGFGGAAPRYFYPGNGRNYYAGLQLSYSL